MHSFLLELGLILLALAVLGAAAGRLGLSPIPFFLLTGLLQGEGGLHDLGASAEFVGIAGEIGVLLLLLLLGLEYSASELVTNLKSQYPSGAVDFVLNATPGAAMALLLGWGPVAAVALAGPRLRFRVALPVLRQRPADVLLFLRELAFLVTSDIALVALVGLDQLPVTRHACLRIEVSFAIPVVQGAYRLSSLRRAKLRRRSAQRRIGPIRSPASLSRIRASSRRVRVSSRFALITHHAAVLR